MCDQTEVTYSPGDVVWVKLGPVWWPGQVQDYDGLPEEITHDLRKRPIAVVKFFQEDSYEYVKNLNQIYHYNCRKKEEFIKKGLDMVRSSNTREVPSNMSMFPNDIVMAEHITGGDPKILESETFAPEQKTNYSDLFGSAKKSTGKKGKAESLKKEYRRHSESPVRSNRKTLSNLPNTIPRPITHPRFITKALEGKSDHEVRIRCQISIPKDDEDSCSTDSDKKKYKCHLCDFQSARLNVIILHNKSHSAGFIDAQNAVKAKIKTKERERISLGPISLSEQTPTSVTSRGRVKSLPKKLMDYTDEPPPKMLKEKSYSKQVKEETCESPKENSAEKTPKKPKLVIEKAAVKRPLFGKRKSAKEKAELAAKIKQENEAMKETLLKDWDDDDVNEEEVELERLKQALESTTTSSLEDETENLPKETETTVEEKSISKNNEQSLIKGSAIPKAQDDVKSKVFEFDDSEDSLPVNINFRHKNKPEKFTDDKFKKPRPPKPLTKPKSKSSIPIPPPPLFSEKKDEDKETADLTEAFNALLEETAVPELPDIPTTSVNLNTSLSDQTSDISSSTDLLEGEDSPGNLNLKVNSDVLTSETNLVNDVPMECTSSDNEDVNTSDRVEIGNETVLEMNENQKNMMEVSAVPSAETDSEVISSGDATTTSADFPKVESIPVVEEICGDSTITEITSTCDGSKGFTEEKEALTNTSNTAVDDNTDNKTDYNHTYSAKSCPDYVSNISTEKAVSHVSSKDEECVENDVSTFSVNSDTYQKNESVEDSVEQALIYETEQKSSELLDNSSANNVNPSNTTDVQSFGKDAIPELKESMEVDETQKTEKAETEASVVKEEVVEDLENQDKIKVENQPTQPVLTEQQIPQTDVPQQNTNVQIIVPPSTDQNTGNYQQVETILVPKLEIQGQEKIVNQTISQNLQDMELDINSMPVIIGGEDFIQQEPPKPHLVPIQPKYTESIVISPKANAGTSPKPESVIVHLSEPSSSSQNVQSVISLPSKGGKGGGRGGRGSKAPSKTIKLSASTLKNLGSLQKGGNQQVLILKTASSKDSQEKGSLQKTQGPMNLIQHGNKILILNNPQMSGQNKIKLNPQQQQLLTGGKLAPGTRVFTSKVVATTTPPSTETNKTSTSRSSSKPTQKLVISKGGMLSNVSKIINSNPSGKILSTVPGLKNITSSKGQTIITHNLINAKGGLILPSSSQSISSSNKTTTIITSQSLPSSKGMILTPIASKGGQIISGNQKLRIVSSKAPLSGTKFVVQSPSGKTGAVDALPKGQQIKLISGLRGQTSGSTIFIQTSQGLVAKSISSNTVSAAGTTKAISPAAPKTVGSSLPSPAKIRVSATSSQPPIVIQQSRPTAAVQQIIQKPVNMQPTTAVKKVTVQKVKQSPNILQKGQRKSTPRGTKGGSRSKTQTTSKVTEPILLSTSANLPVITQPTLVQAQIPQNSEGLLYLTIDESGNYRQVDSKSLLTLEGAPSDGPRTIYIPASNQPQDVGNMFLTIDDAGMTQLVNIAPPTSSTTFTQESPAPAQDILAKALANTQVFQQESILPDVDVTSALASSVDSSSLVSGSYVEQSQYPAPSLSHSVQETSLTLTQPIMTPLEVPSNVSPSLGQISTLPSNYITANLLNTKQKSIHPSMPLLTEESLTSQTRGEPVFLLDSSNNIIPLTSGSQTSFQLTLDDSMVTMSSASGGSVLPQTYQVVSGDLLASQLITNQDTLSLQKEEKIASDKKESASENIGYQVLEETSQITMEEEQASQHSGILREALEAPQNFKSESYLNSVEEAESGHLKNIDHTANTNEETCRLANFESIDPNPELVTDKQHTDGETLMEVTHSLKRGLGEEQTVTSSSDHQDDLKRIRLEER